MARPPVRGRAPLSLCRGARRNRTVETHSIESLGITQRPPHSTRSDADDGFASSTAVYFISPPGRWASLKQSQGSDERKISLLKSSASRYCPQPIGVSNSTPCMIPRACTTYQDVPTGYWCFRKLGDELSPVRDMTQRQSRLCSMQDRHRHVNVDSTTLNAYKSDTTGVEAKLKARIGSYNPVTQSQMMKPEHSDLRLGFHSRSSDQSCIT